MNLADRISAFSLLGKLLSEKKIDQKICKKAEENNRWFTQKNINFSILEISKMLEKENLNKWINNYPKLNKYKTEKNVAVIMAGNIPLVGFHDFLSVLISGHKIIVKLSTKDNILLKEIAKLLIEIEPKFEKKITFTDSILKNFDAVIATGSDNSSKYFDYYFNKYPHIIRKNRTSIAILNGKETEQDFKNLGTDIFAYYGLGCRNVSKIFVPNNYNFTAFLDSMQSFSYVYTNNKYANNYDYNSSLFLLNKIKHFSNNFLLLTKNISYSSPISVIYYENYSNIETIYNRIENDKEKLQVIVSNISDEHTKFGQTQSPNLTDYADNIDTLNFLLNL